MQTAAIPKETLHGIVSEVFYRKPNGWSIGRLRQVSPQGQLGMDVPAAGMLPEAMKDSLFDFRGHWQDTEKYGRQFYVENVISIPPTTPEGIGKYLSAKSSKLGKIKGLGVKGARKLADFFQQNLATVLDAAASGDRGPLYRCTTISRNLLDKVADKWKADEIFRTIGAFLSDHDINPALSKDLYREFGDRWRDILENFPYELTRIQGIGFAKAHELARKMGWPERSLQKTEACVRYALLQVLDDGHTYLVDNQLADSVINLAFVSREEAKEAIERVIAGGSVKTERITKGTNVMRLVYLPWIYWAETNLASRLGELAAKKPRQATNLSENLVLIADRMARDLSEEQKTAVRNAFASSVSVITGGPGTGKTSTLEMLVKTAQAEKFVVLLAAPTGRAANRLAQVTQQPASTIHRLLEYDAETKNFMRNRENPLKADFIVVDEFSMADISLANNLMQAIPDGARIVLIGDVDQLPAVGPGLVLKDMILSKRIPVTTLTQIFRQAEGSLIVQNAHSIRRGEQPIFGRPGSQADCFLMAGPPAGIENWTRDRIVKLVQSDIPSRLGLDPLRDVQVLAPMKKGDVGVYELNSVLQEVLNPAGRPIEITKEKTFRIGDKLMQMKNNYDLNVFNGDQGILEEASTEDKTLVINFYGRKVEFEFSDARYLELSYASTIHKSQGGEWPVVVICMLKRHFVMLERNLIYTALTRAKRLCLFVGSDVAVRMAVDNSQTHERNTLLKTRIRQQIKEAV
jgi:exodeoxyribonuclease V alpha subunit